MYTRTVVLSYCLTVLADGSQYQKILYRMAVKPSNPASAASMFISESAALHTPGGKAPASYKLCFRRHQHHALRRSSSATKRGAYAVLSV